MTEVITELTKAHHQNKLLDMAVVYRRKLYDDEPTTGPDGEKIYSMSVFHAIVHETVFTTVGLVDALKDYVKGFLCDDDDETA